MDLDTPYMFTLIPLVFHSQKFIKSALSSCLVLQRTSNKPIKNLTSKLNSRGQGKENSKKKTRKFEDKLTSTKIKTWLNQRE